MIIQYIKKNIQLLHYKKLFLFGAYISIITLALFSALIDFLAKYYIDGVINFTSGIMALLSYMFICRREDNYQLSAIILFWIAAIVEFIYIIVHQVDFNIIFTLLIPILAFFTMSKRNIIINLLLYYTILSILLIYYYYNTTNHYILHYIEYLYTYIVANLYVNLFGFFYYLSIDEFINRLSKANKTQKILLNEVHHRVKNNLNLIASILGLQEYSTQNKEAKNLLEQNRHRIESIAILHEVLYKNNLLEKIDTKPYFNNLINKIVSSSSNKNIKIISNIHNLRLNMSSMLQLGIMLNEMLLNTIKHNKNDTPIVKISLEKIDKVYHFIYCDNSKDIDLMKLQQGFGYNLILLSASSFNAKIDIDISKHFCYDIALNSLEDFIEL